MKMKEQERGKIRYICFIFQLCIYIHFHQYGSENVFSVLLLLLFNVLRKKKSFILGSHVHFTACEMVCVSSYHHPASIYYQPLCVHATSTSSIFFFLLLNTKIGKTASMYGAQLLSTLEMMEAHILRVDKAENQENRTKNKRILLWVIRTTYFYSTMQTT